VELNTRRQTSSQVYGTPIARGGRNLGGKRTEKKADETTSQKRHEDKTKRPEN
jgi:hypothetical protein